jgi:hypothetical protein
MTWSISGDVDLRAVAMVVIAIIAVALVYLVYLGVLKVVEERKRQPKKGNAK